MTMRPPSKEAADRRAKVYDAIYVSAERGIGAAAIAAQFGMTRWQVQYALERLTSDRLIYLRGGRACHAVWVCRWVADKNEEPSAISEPNAEDKEFAEAWTRGNPLRRFRGSTDWQRDQIRPPGPSSVWEMAQRFACAAQ